MKTVKVIGRVKSGVEANETRRQLEFNLAYEGQYAVNVIVECGLSAATRGAMLADLLVYVQNRLEQVAGEVDQPGERGSESRPTGSGLAPSIEDAAIIERAHEAAASAYAPAAEDLSFLR